MNKIAEMLLPLSRPIETLRSLVGNPQKGNIPGIKASYAKFGQVKPLVGVENQDGTVTIIAGNHQLAAATELGWTELAVLLVDFNDQDAIAFALADNRLSELSHTDPDLLFDMILQIDEPEFLEVLGWDDFELAAMEPDEAAQDDVDMSAGYVPAQLQGGDGKDEIRFEGTDGDTKDMVERGATATDSAGAKALAQYTILFDSQEQQKTWYGFLRWVKAQPALKDLTTGGQITWFVETYMGQDH